MKYLGISGKIGSGKDTLAKEIKMIIESFGLAYNHVSFADHLKVTTAQMFGIDLNDCYTQEGKNKMIDGFDLTIGEALQQVGVKMREIDPDIWIKTAISNAKEVPCDLAVGTDCRFPNEVMAIEELGMVVRMIGDPCDVNKNTKRDTSHISETALDDYPWPEENIIYNRDRDMTRLHFQAVAVVKRMFPHLYGKD